MIMKRSRLSRGSASIRRSRLRSDYNTWFREHPNFMTPTRIAYSIRGGRVVELSTGESFERGVMMYGVTELVPRADGGFWSTIRSKPFHDEKEARAYYAELLK